VSDDFPPGGAEVYSPSPPAALSLRHILALPRGLKLKDYTATPPGALSLRRILPLPRGKKLKDYTRCMRRKKKLKDYTATPPGP